MQVHIHGLVIMMSLSSGIQHQQSNLTILLKNRNKGSFKVHDVTFILKNYQFNWKHFQSSRNKPDEETLLLFWQQLCEIPSVIYRWSHKIRKQQIEDKSQYGPPITREISAHLASIQEESHTMLLCNCLTGNNNAQSCDMGGQGRVGRLVKRGS